MYNHEARQATRLVLRPCAQLTHMVVSDHEGNQVWRSCPHDDCQIGGTLVHPEGEALRCEADTVDGGVCQANLIGNGICLMRHRHA